MNQEHPFWRGGHRIVIPSLESPLAADQEREGAIGALTHPPTAGEFGMTAIGPLCGH